MKMYCYISLKNQEMTEYLDYEYLLFLHIMGGLLFIGSQSNVHQSIITNIAYICGATLCIYTYIMVVIEFLKGFLRLIDH